MGYTQIPTTKMNHGTGFTGWERTDAWTEQLVVSMKAVKHRWTHVADPVHLVFCRAEELSNNVNTGVLTILILITCFLLQSQCFKLFTNLYIK